MRSLVVFFLLISFTVAATAASMDPTESSASKDDEDASCETTESAAESFVKAYGNDSKVARYVGVLVDNLDKDHVTAAIQALNTLSKLDFSRDQLAAYGALLGETVPTILESRFADGDDNVSQATHQTIDFLRQKNYLAASNAAFDALGYFEPDSEDHEVLEGILQSYRPLVKGVDFMKLAATGKWILDSALNSTPETISD